MAIFAPRSSARHRAYSTPQGRPSFSAVGEDAETASMIETATTSSASTFPLGAASGRAIQRFGELLLQGAGRLNRQYKFHTIENHLKHQNPQDWPRVTLNDLLELQRVDIYPDAIRCHAWDLIFLAMERNGGKRIAEALKQWGADFTVEVRLFIQQLAICKEYGWRSHPGRADIPIPRDRVFDNRHPAADRSQAMFRSFMWILLGLMEENTYADVLHEIFDSLPVFARLCAEDYSPDTGPNIALSLFFNSFAALHPFPEIPPPNKLIRKLPVMIGAYPAACALLQYIFTSPLDVRNKNIEVVVDHILRALRPFISQEPEQGLKDIVFRLHPYIRTSQTLIHPTWPFFCFAIALTWQSADATRLFLDAGIIKGMRDFFPRHTERSMCLLLLSLLATMSIHFPLDDRALRFKANVEAVMDGRASPYRPTRRLGPMTQGQHGRAHSDSVASTSSDGHHSPGPTFSGDQSLNVSGPPSDFRPSRLQSYVADASAYAQQAVEWDEANQTREAVTAYWKSAQRLVQAMKLKAQENRPSRSAHRMLESYEAYVSRMNALCTNKHVTPPAIEAPPALLPLPPDEPPPPYSLVVEAATPQPSAPPTPVGTLRQRNQELLAIWR